MEDVHSLLTDVPPPSGTPQASSEIKPVCTNVLLPLCRTNFLFSLEIQSLVVFEVGFHLTQGGTELSM